MTLSPGMEAAAARPVALWVALVELALPGHTLRLCDGAGTVPWGVRTFRGADPVYGALETCGSFTDGVGDESPSFTLTLLPPTKEAAATMVAATVQGSVVSIWLGIVNPETGQLVDEPHPAFVGEIDVPTLRVGKGKRLVEYLLVSFEERTFEDDEGARLNDSFHASIWPGETGLVFHARVGDQMPWGADGPRPVNVTTGGGGGRTGLSTEFAGL